MMVKSILNFYNPSLTGFKHYVILLHQNYLVEWLKWAVQKSKLQNIWEGVLWNIQGFQNHISFQWYSHFFFRVKENLRKENHKRWNEKK